MLATCPSQFFSLVHCARLRLSEDDVPVENVTAVRPDRCVGGSLGHLVVASWLFGPFCDLFFGGSLGHLALVLW